MIAEPMTSLPRKNKILDIKVLEQSQLSKDDNNIDNKSNLNTNRNMLSIEDTESDQSNSVVITALGRCL